MLGSETGGRPTASRWILIAMVVVLIFAGLAVGLLRPNFGPPPPEIAGDRRLVEGREIYLSRCLACHGEKGRGDGPLAKGLSGPAPRNLAEDEWKHGTRPEQVMTVLREGVSGTAMGGWSSSLKTDQMLSVAAYLYRIAGKPIPPELR